MRGVWYTSTLTPRPSASKAKTVTGFATRTGAVLSTQTPPKSSIDPGVASLDTVLGNDLHAPVAATGNDEPVDIEEGLFALPMSPRSPEMAKSPFSLL